MKKHSSKGSVSLFLSHTAWEAARDWHTVSPASATQAPFTLFMTLFSTSPHAQCGCASPVITSAFQPAGRKKGEGKGHARL